MAKFHRASEYLNTRMRFLERRNMGRIRKCRKGRALAAVQSMLSFPVDFSEVLVIREDTFGHQNKVIGCMIEKVKSLEPVSRGDLSTLGDFSNALANLVRSVEQLHRPEQLANPQLREDLVRELPPDLTLQWGEHALTRTDDINLKTFSEWIRQRARAANYVLPTIATPSNRSGSSNCKPTSSVTRFRETTLATHLSTQKCIYCSKEQCHAMFKAQGHECCRASRMGCETAAVFFMPRAEAYGVPMQESTEVRSIGMLEKIPPSPAPRQPIGCE